MSKTEELLKSWMRLCTDPRTSCEQLENAAYWESINCPKDYDIRLAVAKHRNTTSEVLAKLAMVKHLPVQIAVAGHGNLAESTATKLLKFQLRELRRALAGNPKIPFFVMQKLARDFADVRMRLAKNPALPLSIMRDLAKAKNPNIRLALSQNRRLNPAIMERLGSDLDVEVRCSIVEHPDMPLAGLRHMALDKNTSVKQSVLARIANDFGNDKSVLKVLIETTTAETDIGRQVRSRMEEVELREQEVAAVAKAQKEEGPEEDD